MALTNYFTGTTTPTDVQASTYSPSTLQSSTALVGNNLESFLNPNSTLMQQARQQGLETAATRGGINSSIAAGASQRASLDAASGLATQATSIDAAREQVQAQNWIDQQGFNRDLQGQLAMTGVTSAANSLQAIQQYALSDPELYTPEVVSGLNNFFNQNMKNIFTSYFNS